MVDVCLLKYWTMLFVSFFLDLCYLKLYAFPQTLFLNCIFGCYGLQASCNESYLNILAQGCPSFNCHFCGRCHHNTCSSNDTDLVLTQQKPLGWHFLFACTAYYQGPSHMPEHQNQSNQKSPIKR